MASLHDTESAPLWAPQPHWPPCHPATDRIPMAPSALSRSSLDLRRRPLGMSPTMQAFDYIIVGAGAAGAVIACRLSEMADARVLLHRSRPSRPQSQHPSAGWVVQALRRRSHLELPDHAQRHAGDRKMLFLQGRVIGGGSSVNGPGLHAGRPSRLAAVDPVDPTKLSNIRINGNTRLRL